MERVTRKTAPAPVWTCRVSPDTVTSSTLRRSAPGDRAWTCASCCGTMVIVSC